MKYKWDFFIAHAGGDTPTAQTLYDLLEPYSAVFLDSKILLPGDTWGQELIVAQKNSRITVVLVSARTEQAFYQQEEIAAAISMARNDKSKHRVVPVFLYRNSTQNENVPYGLRSLHGIYVSDKKGLTETAKRLLQLLSLIKSQKTTSNQNTEKMNSIKSTRGPISTIRPEVYCEKCLYFRRIRPASQSLQQAIGKTDSATSSALADIQQEERQQQIYETQLREERQQYNNEIWGFKPTASVFCGLHEDDEIYALIEVKNSEGKCPDFVEDAPKKKSCNACVYRRSQGTPSDDEVKITYLDMQSRNAIYGISSQLPEKQLEQYQKNIGPQKASEIKAAYDGHGILSSKPQYLDYCAKFSQEDAFTICVLRNPHDTCSGWNDTPKTETLLITESYKRYECGIYGFSLDGDGNLVVDVANINTPHRPKHYYKLSHMQTNQWQTLKNPDGEPLAIHVLWNQIVLRVQVGSAPLAPSVLLGVSQYSREWKMKVQLNGYYSHPIGGFSLQYKQSFYPDITKVISIFIKTSGELIEFPLENLLDHEWVTLRFPTGQMLPVKVYKEEENLLAEWLPLEGLV